MLSVRPSSFKGALLVKGAGVGWGAFASSERAKLGLLFRRSSSSSAACESTESECHPLLAWWACVSKAPTGPVSWLARIVQASKSCKAGLCAEPHVHFGQQMLLAELFNMIRYHIMSKLVLTRQQGNAAKQLFSDPTIITSYRPHWWQHSDTHLFDCHICHHGTSTLLDESSSSVADVHERQ